MIDPVTITRCRMVGAARLSVAFCRANGLDWPTLVASCGGLFLANIKLHTRRRFTFSPLGVEACVVEAFGEDGESVEDLVAWPVDQPRTVLTALGRAAVLGSWNATNPASFAFGPLRLYRTPLAWLQEGGRGATPFDLARATSWLREIDGPIAGEDRAHAAEIRKALVGSLRLERLHAPRATSQPVAA